ncbi:MAG: UbiA family prenyltransferase [Candidatus Thermoplasmatota archaeon]|nr:UbiA family prenyltransferase [Candidatus Thermoplasmatota archaeon]
MNLKKRFSLKDKSFAHFETWRLYTVIWCGLVSLTGSCIAYGDLPPIKIAVLSLFIPMMGWIAGLYLSDYLDRKLDAIQKPHRPIPSGRIKPKEALVFGAFFAATGFILSLLLNIYNIILVFLVAALVFAYAKISKSKGITGNLNRGVVTVLAYLFGVFSINQSLQSIPIYIWLISIVFLLHDTNSNLVGAIRDIEGDKKGGYQTIPVKYGIKNSIIISLILTIVWFSLTLFIPYHYNFLKLEFYFIMIIDLLILISFYLYLIKALHNYSREKGLKFHEFFVLERITLASAFIFGIINLYIAACIFLIAILVTSISQYLLRKRYEFMEKK